LAATFAALDQKAISFLYRYRVYAAFAVCMCLLSVLSVLFLFDGVTWYTHNKKHWFAVF